MQETCLTFGGHSARVKIEDKEIPHYAIHVDPEKKEVTCWIASEAEKAFSVIWFDYVEVNYPISGELFLDGHRARLLSSRHGLIRAGPIIFRHGIASDSSYAPFLFSALAVTDDDTYLDTSPCHSMGEIKLVIHRSTVPLEIAEESPTIVLPRFQMVHERSKKAIAHRVNYGSEIPRPPIKQIVEFVETLVSFVFKYRPLEMLRASDIAPRNPEPFEPQESTLDTPPTSEKSSGKEEHSGMKKEAESESESDDEDRMREKALLAELEKIRKGRQLKDKRPKKKLKKEEKPVFTPGEIIDLT